MMCVLNLALRSLVLLLAVALCASEFPNGQKRLLAHREEPKHSNPNGPCSTMVDVGPSLTIADLRAMLSERLGFPVGRITFDGQDVESLGELVDGSLLSVFDEVVPKNVRIAEELHAEVKLEASEVKMGQHIALEPECTEVAEDVAVW